MTMAEHRCGYITRIGISGGRREWRSTVEWYSSRLHDGQATLENGAVLRRIAAEVCRGSAKVEPRGAEGRNQHVPCGTRDIKSLLCDSCPFRNCSNPFETEGQTLNSDLSRFSGFSPILK